MAQDDPLNEGFGPELLDQIGLARRQSLSDNLARSAKRHGDRTAIICREVEWSYSEFAAIVDRLAAGLAEAGIGPGDRVAMLARNSHAFIAMRYAIARADAVLVPVNFMLNAEDVGYILEHSGARMLFVDASTQAVANEARPASVEMMFGLAGEHGPPPVDLPSWEELLSDNAPPLARRGGRDVLQILYTSGTESRPKGAMLSHDAVLWQYQSCMIDCSWSKHEVAVHAMPLFHCAQLDAMMGPALQAGACNIVTADPSAANLIDLLDTHHATIFFAPPTVWIDILRSPELEGRELKHLVKGVYGASIMPVEVLRQLRERFPGLGFWNAYGQTEIAPVATLLFPEEHEAKLGSAGRATQHVETRIVDDDMNDVAPGEIGEIVHRSPHLMNGYWRDPERTAEAFAGGWFHSGDLGRMDAEGYITVVDRKKDMIKSGGENVSSREVEEAVYQHPAVSEVAVIGLPCPRWVEAVTAVVVLKQGEKCCAEELTEFCKEKLSGFKRPKDFLFRDSLPRNASGKILKRDLRMELSEPQ